MSEFIVRLPDVGEGVAEAELVAWRVAVGDAVTPDSAIAEVLTDKATVEIYSPVSGRVSTLYGVAGDVLAVGSDFVIIQTASAPEPPVAPPDAVANVASGHPSTDALALVESVAPPDAVADVASGRPSTAAPAVRERALRLGVDLDAVTGSGPEGRVTHQDLDGLSSTTSVPGTSASNATAQIPLVGLRRRIAAHMTTSSSRIPHITYVDEIDMTRLEELRRSLPGLYPNQPRLTVLPFIMGAIVRALVDHPNVNATFDDESQVLTTYSAVHVGIATQAPNGLLVPVVREAQSMDIWQRATELARVTTAARQGTAVRAELSGSTVTITSLGALGGLMTTPIINHPEVAIVGINKMQTRPVWDGAAFLPRTMMNLSSSFDHRIVDGWEAATFVQRIKGLLEQPALLFIAPPT